MKSFRLLISAAAMAVLILDSQTALDGARAGLELCIRSVIPSLFPFLFLSAILTGAGAASMASFLRPLGRLCRIPQGGETLLAAGLIGGYPVGAQCIAQAYGAGRLDKQTAHRMLGFCSNAGPSFIFGFLSTCFAPKALWVLWGIHILSAILTGILLPGSCQNRIHMVPSTPVSTVSALERSVRTMALICGWVTVFRILLAFLRRWCLWMLPQWGDILVSGALELTNGCIQLPLVDAEGFRFILASGILAWGGVCVGLQTVSVTGSLGTGAYFPGKVIQTVISLMLSSSLQYVLYPAQQRFHGTFLLMPIAVLCVGSAFLCIYKKHCSILRQQGV